MVHPCDKTCGNKTESGYCATTACINPQYSNIGTAQYGQGVQKRIITNADRIRAMTDEELARWVTSGIKSVLARCKGYELSPAFEQEMFDWLREEVTDG